ncbi:hypothetical protein BJX65DRAFT_39579 [Aspergillus insuetus]
MIGTPLLTIGRFGPLFCVSSSSARRRLVSENTIVRSELAGSCFTVVIPTGSATRVFKGSQQKRPSPLFCFFRSSSAFSSLHLRGPHLCILRSVYPETFRPALIFQVEVEEHTFSTDGNIESENIYVRLAGRFRLSSKSWPIGRVRKRVRKRWWPNSLQYRSVYTVPTCWPSMLSRCQTGEMFWSPAPTDIAGSTPLATL